MPVFVLGSCKPTSSLGVLPVPAPTPALRSTLARLKYQPQSPEPAVCPTHPQLETSPPESTVQSGLFLLGVVHCLVLFCLHQRLPAYSCLRTAVCSCSNPSQWSVLRMSQILHGIADVWGSSRSTFLKSGINFCKIKHTEGIK